MKRGRYNSEGRRARKAFAPGGSRQFNLARSASPQPSATCLAALRSTEKRSSVGNAAFSWKDARPPARPLICRRRSQLLVFPETLQDPALNRQGKKKKKKAEGEILIKAYRQPGSARWFRQLPKKTTSPGALGKLCSLPRLLLFYPGARRMLPALSPLVARGGVRAALTADCLPACLACLLVRAEGGGAGRGFQPSSFWPIGRGRKGVLSP